MEATINGKIYNIKKHIGRIKNTGTRVVVVFRKLPDDPSNCLIVEVDHLPDRYSDIINSLLNNEGQKTNEFYEVLARRVFDDGSNCLQTLHTSNFLRKLPIDMIEMVPMTNMPVPLSMINEQIDGLGQMSTPVVSEVAEKPVDEGLPLTAEEMLIKAKTLKEEAFSLEEQAYVLAPELRPGVGRPKLTELEKQIKKDERNARRRAKYLAEKNS